MLKPIEALQAHGRSQGMNETDLQRKQEKLLDALIHPMRSTDGESIVEVFAHGAEATRLVAIEKKDERNAHWAVQKWDAIKEGWLTQTSYDMMSPAGHQMAYLEAKNSYPILQRDIAETKWAKINSHEDDALEQVFDSQARLAEFWYETKVIDWNERGGSHPWPVIRDMADTAFLHEGRPDPFLGEKRVEQVETLLSNISSTWEKSAASPVLSGSLHYLDLDFDESQPTIQFVEYASAEEAINHIRQQGCDAYLTACGLEEELPAGAESFSYQHKRDAGISNDELIASLETFIEQNKQPIIAAEPIKKEEDIFLISIYYERNQPGNSSDRGVTIEREFVDADNLKKYSDYYEITEPSSTDPRITPYIWFDSTSPNESYSLHIHEINGDEPEAEDYQKIANLIGAKFDYPIEFDNSKQKIKSPENDSLTF